MTAMHQQALAPMMGKQRLTEGDARRGHARITLQIGDIQTVVDDTQDVPGVRNSKNEDSSMQ